MKLINQVYINIWRKKNIKYNKQTHIKYNKLKNNYFYYFIKLFIFYNFNLLTQFLTIFKFLKLSFNFNINFYLNKVFNFNKINNIKFTEPPHKKFNDHKLFFIINKNYIKKIHYYNTMILIFLNTLNMKKIIRAVHLIMFNYKFKKKLFNFFQFNFFLKINLFYNNFNILLFINTYFFIIKNYSNFLFQIIYIIKNFKLYHIQNIFYLFKFFNTYNFKNMSLNKKTFVFNRNISYFNWFNFLSLKFIWYTLLHNFNIAKFFILNNIFNNLETSFAFKNFNTNILLYDFKIKNLKKKNFFYRKKKLLPYFSFYTYTHDLIYFLEYCCGQKIYLYFFKDLNFLISKNEKIKSIFWGKNFKRLNNLIFNSMTIRYFIYAILSALKMKDTEFLISIFVCNIKKLKFWKIKQYFYNLWYIFNFFFYPNFNNYNIVGFKLLINGKIGVTGNARTRNILFKFGNTSYSMLSTRVSYSFDTIITNTGVLGLSVWLFY